MSRPHNKDASPVVRCEIYKRKSTEEGLDQDFNTLDAQRESAEAYITSQTSERHMFNGQSSFDETGHGPRCADSPVKTSDKAR